jgi:hypothetical protein
MRFRNYEQFLNEGFFEKALSNIKEFLKKAGDFFTGVGSKFMNALLAQKKRELPSGVKIYPTKLDIEIASKYGVNISQPKLELKESEEAYMKFMNDSMLNEAKIETKYPDIGKVIDVDSDGLERMLRNSIEGGKNLKPLIIWGAPGIGKTAIINSLAKEYFGSNAKEQKRMIELDLMTMSPEDFFLPAIKDRDTPEAKATRLADEWLPVRRIDDPEAEKYINGPDGKGGILFMDELARCSSKVQNVCLKIVDERKVGNYVLGEKWIIIAAANRKSDLSDDEQATFSWSSTLANRFRQINYAAGFEDWSPWAKQAKDETGKLIVRPEVLAFLRFSGEYFHNLDPERFSSGSGGSEAWPSPRTWTNASQEINAAEERYEKRGWKDRKGNTVSKEDWEKEVEEILAASVGLEAARAFVGFKSMLDKINPEDIKYVFEKPEKAPLWKGLKIDEQYALIAAVIFHASNEIKDLNKKQMINFVEWLGRNKDIANSTKAMQMISDALPALNDSDDWVDDAKGRLVELYPSFMKKK